MRDVQSADGAYAVVIRDPVSFHPVVHDRVDAWRHELDEVPIESALECDGRVGQSLGGHIYLREVAPHAHRRAIDGFTVNDREYSLAVRHLGGSGSKGHAGTPWA